MNLILWSISSNNRGNTNLTTDFSRRDSGGLLSLASGSGSTRGRFMPSVESYWMYAFEGCVSTVSCLGSITCSGLGTIASTYSDSSDVSDSLTLSSENSIIVTSRCDLE